MIPSSISGDIEVPASVDAQGNVHIGHQIVHNYYASADWQKLQQRLADALENYQSFPEHFKFAEQLQKVQDEIESFKRDIVKLTQDFQKIPLNTERLKQAKAYFDEGDYEKARGVLDIEALGQEQEVLLAEKDVLETKLAANADEFMLLAQLTALNFDLGDDRILKTRAAFEQAMASQFSLYHVLDYASFLQRENQRSEAIQCYTKALALYRLVIEEQPELHEPAVALILDRLGGLLGQDASQHDLAKIYYEEALAIRRRLASEQPDIYDSDVAVTLNNLANLLSKDTSQRDIAKVYYQESLAIERRLTPQKPSAYESRLANTLSNLAGLLLLDDSQYDVALQYFEEALATRRRLASEQPMAYESAVATSLNNLGAALVLSNQRSLAQTYLGEALTILRRLARQQPEVYEREVAHTLKNLGLALGSSASERVMKQAYLEEALAIIWRLAAQEPALYELDLAKILIDLGRLLSENSPQSALGKMYFEEALTIHRRLARQQPLVYQPELCRILAMRGLSCFLEGERQAALVYLEEAAQLIQPLYEMQPSVFMRQYESIQRGLSFLH